MKLWAPSSKRFANNAYTLIELLVVSTIVAILASLLLPSLARAKEQANRTKCLSNLRQWGIGHTLYSNDNLDTLNSTVIDSGIYVHPTVLNLEAAFGRTHITIEAIAPYFGGVGIEAIRRAGIQWCPSAPSVNPENVDAEARNWGHVSIGYMYFARVDDWPVGRATIPEVITGRKLESDRLLMEDIIYQWAGDNLFRYNHGKGNDSAHSDLSKMSGANCLYGDGRSEWKPARKFDRKAMESGENTTGFVFGYGQTRSFY